MTCNTVSTDIGSAGVLLSDVYAESQRGCVIDWTRDVWGRISFATRESAPNFMTTEDKKCQSHTV